MKKKLISIFLCAAICLSLMPTVAFAADETPITDIAITAQPSGRRVGRPD